MKYRIVYDMYDGELGYSIQCYRFRMYSWEGIVLDCDSPDWYDTIEEAKTAIKRLWLHGQPVNDRTIKRLLRFEARLNRKYKSSTLADIKNELRKDAIVDEPEVTVTQQL